MADYVKPFDATDPNASFVNGNPSAGVSGSIPDALMWEVWQRELKNLIVQSGQTASNSDLTQVYKAVRTVSGSLVHYGLDTSTTANSLTMPTVSPSISSLSDGMIFEIVPNNTITGNPSATIAGQSSVSVLRRDGLALQSADIVAGVPFFGIIYSGALRILNAVPSEIAITTTTVINGLKIPGGTPFQYATPGTYTLAIASGITFGVRECRGAGGGGGGASGLNAAGSGGGGGGNAQAVFTATSASILTITVGAGGTGGAGGGSPANGATGGTTSVVLQSGTATGTDGTNYTAGQTLCAATGGGFGYAGSGAPQSTSFGLGGVGSGTGLNDNGDSGGFPIGPINSAYLGGSGGTSAGSGGSPGPNYGAGGNSSAAPGIGGNGSSNNAPGGNGAPGRVTITK